MKKDQLLKMNLQYFAEDSNDNEVIPESSELETEADKNNGDNDSEQEKKYTDEEVNAIIDQKFAKFKKKLEEETANEKRKAKMTAEQLAEEERKELEEELAEYKRKETIRENKDRAIQQLQKHEITGFEPLLDFVVTDNEGETDDRVASLAKVLKDRDAQIKEEVVKGLGTREIIGGSSASNQSIGAQLAQEENKKKTTIEDPWKRD